MADGNKTNKEKLDSARKALSTASKKAKEKLAAASGKASKANKALREMKGRRIVDAVEVTVGAAAAGAARGMGLTYEVTDGLEVGAGAAVGAVALVGGALANSYDLQSAGLGMLAFEVGRVVEDAVEQAQTEA